MDSNKFQKKIDENIRDEREGASKEEHKDEANNNQATEEGKGKGVEGKENRGEGSKNQEANNMETQDTSKIAKQPKAKTPATRQSKRKNGQPPEPKIQLVGPVRIKKLKSKAADNVPQINETTHNATHQQEVAQPRQTKERSKHVQPNHHKEPKSETEDESAGEDAAGNRVIGGIILDDIVEKAANSQPVEAIPESQDDRMSKRLDAKIEAEFAAGDRGLYDQLAEEKRNWLEDETDVPKDMADIGVRNKKIERQAERQTVMSNNNLVLDNPYAHGQLKRYIDPIDGSNWESRPTAWDDPSRGESKYDKERSEVAKNSQSIRGNPRNYIPNFRSNFRSGRENGGENGFGGGQSGNGNGNWGRGRQGEENLGGQQTHGNGKGNVSKGFAQKK
ncbi:hypothetical protein DFH28DRAFT_1078609 [Melampsora americana]|nr:hypothetical protein DFH28DRAFT_1078609 [Melampsora americana]